MLLEHSHTRLFMYCPWLLSHHRQRWNLKSVLSGLGRKLADSCSRTLLPIRNIMWVINVIYVCHLSFSSGHIKKIFKKSGEIKFEYILFNSISLKYFKIESIKKLWDILHSLFLLSLWNPVCVIHGKHMSILTKLRFMCLMGRLWLVVTALDNMVLAGVPEAFLGEYCTSHTEQYHFNLWSCLIAHLISIFHPQGCSTLLPEYSSCTGTVLGCECLGVSLSLSLGDLPPRPSFLVLANISSSGDLKIPICRGSSGSVEIITKHLES